MRPRHGHDVHGWYVLFIDHRHMWIWHVLSSAPAAASVPAAAPSTACPTTSAFPSTSAAVANYL